MTLCGYRAYLVHFGIVRFFMAIPTEYEGTRGTESAARRSAFLREPIGFDMFSVGSTLGLRAPDCAKETSLPGLSSFDSRRGCVLRGEGDSGTTQTCTSPIYARASRVAAQASLFMQSSESGRVKWKPHCGLSGLSSFDSRRGCVLRGEGDSGTTQTCAPPPPWCII